MRLTLTFTLLFALTLGGAAAVSASPTPVPGGANQAEGVPTTFGKASFNGEVRVTPRQLRDANAADDFIAPTGQKWIVLIATTANGTNKSLDMQQFVATIVNADGESVAADPDKITPVGCACGIAPGAGWRERVAFLVPNDFKPVKIILLPYDHKHKAFRITVGPNDYTPAAS